MKKKYIILFVFVFAVLCVFAQSKNIRKEFNRKIFIADEYYKYENYKSALPLYEDLFLMDSLNTEVNFKLGVCKFNLLRNKTDLMKYFEFSKNDYPDSYYYLGRLFHLKGNFIKSLDHYLAYKNSVLSKNIAMSVVDFHVQKSLVAKEMFNQPVDAKIKNIGNKINSSFYDYVPLISADEYIMYFTSRRSGSTGNLKDPNDEYFEDIYSSEYKDSLWSEPVNLGIPINTETHDACVYLSPDGQSMFIYRTNKQMTGGDIYFTELKNNNWTDPVILDSEVNSPTGLETSAALSPDQNTVYFSSNREGGFGGKDLYRITKMPDGSWSKAQNLGGALNTPYDEDAPFIHPDGITLFFSSQGHRNMGGFDIFMTRKEGNNWTAPENMGYPINTVDDDIYFVLSANGKHGYFSSTKSGGYGGSDIYVVDMPGDENNFLILKGTITTSEPEHMKLSATITVIDYETKELQGIYRTNKKTGKYTLVILPRKRYKVIVESDGYHSFIDELDLREKLHIEDLFKNINLKQQKFIQESLDDSPDDEEK
ncbi:MAG: hypothetical protein ABIJ97_15010 [Bacteroidota bacterium]